MKSLFYIQRKKIIKNTIIIQRAFRHYLHKCDIMAQIRNPYKKYINQETILGDSIDEIDDRYFYTTDNYAFDIRELYKNNLKNPYTNLFFSKSITNQLLRIKQNYDLNNISIDIINDIPNDQILSTMITDLFCKLMQYNTYPNYETFMDYDIDEFYFYIKYVLKNEIIRKYISQTDKKKLFQLYHTDNGDFIYYSIKFLNKLMDLVDDKYTVALIIAEAIND